MAQTFTNDIEVKGITLAIIAYALLLFFTPYQEAPKNILTLVLVLWGIFNFRAVLKNIDVNPIAITAIIFLFSSVIAFFTSSYQEVLELKNSFGPLKIGLILIPVILLSQAHRNFWKLSAIFIAIGGIVSGIDGLINWKGPYPQYNSVGHVNHTALYVCLQFGASLVLLISSNLKIKSLGFISLIISLIFLFTSRSTLALILSLIIFSVFTYVHIDTMRRNITVLLLGILLVLLSESFAFYQTHTGQDFINEINDRISNDITSSRYGIALTAIEGAKSNPIFGAGPRMFRRATDEATIREIMRSENRNYDHEDKDFIHVIHGHNTWINNYVERGLFSLLLFTACGIFTIVYIFRYKPKPTANLEYRNVYLLFATAGIVIFIGGIMQTTFIVEHGLVSAILLTSGAQFLRSHNQS